MGLAGLHPQPCLIWVVAALHMVDSNPYLGATLDERPWLQAVLQLPPFSLVRALHGRFLANEASPLIPRPLPSGLGTGGVSKSGRLAVCAPMRAR